MGHASISVKCVMLQVSGGEYHALFLNPQGDVSSCGIVPYGPFGKSKKPGASVLVGIQFPVKIVQVAAGLVFSACLGDDGRVFTFGENEYGQLGLGDWEDRLEPVEVPNLYEISSLSCGYYHACCLDSNGRTFTFGGNNIGQLGNGTRQDANVPQQINLPDRVIQIASGSEHTVFLIENHSLCVCGSNEFGQLGLENEQQEHMKPVCVPVPDLVRFVACGEHFTLLITQESNIFATGLNNFGQLGVGDPEDKFGWCQVVDHHTQFVVCGARHWMFISDDDGALYGTGSDVSGQLGGIGYQTKPVKLMEDPLAVGCGWDSSFILTQEGIMSCGDNGFSCTGSGQRKWTSNYVVEIGVTQLNNKRIKGPL